MAQKPSNTPDWIPNDTTGIIPPGGSKQIAGWFKEERPPYQFHNWFWNIVSQFIHYFSSQAEYNVTIDTIANEGDYATLAAYILAGSTPGDRVLVKVDEEITGSTMIIPANISLKFLKGKKLWCDEFALTTVLQFSDGVVTEGDLILEYCRATGTLPTAVSFNGNDNNHANVIVKNTSTGTITDAFRTEVDKKGNLAHGEVINSGGGTVTNTLKELGSRNDNYLVIRGHGGVTHNSGDVSLIGWTSAHMLGYLNIPTAGLPALTTLNGRDVAFIDDINEDLRTYRWSKATWSLVGSELNISGIGQPALEALNETDVAFIDSTLDSLRVYRFDGSNWSQVGSGLSVAVTYPALARLNSTDVALFDVTSNLLRTYRWSGSSWSLVGSGLSISGVNYPTITALSELEIALIDEGNDSLRAYRWNGSTWSLVGSGLSVSGQNFALAALNKTDIALVCGQLNIMWLRIYRWSGSSWSLVGVESALENGTTADRPALTALNGREVVEIDLTNDDLSTYRFDFYIGRGPHEVSG